jgi:5-methylcytosine-specific restriction endonuclease McrA
MADADSGIDALFGQESCSIDGCNKPIHVVKHGWCSVHYLRWRAHGDPLVNMRPRCGIHICEGCGVEFKRKGGRTGRFCTPLCVQEYAKRHLAKDCNSVCQTCGKRFVAKRPTRARWCSRSCTQMFRYRDGSSFNEMKRQVGFKGKNNRKECKVWFGSCSDCYKRFCARTSLQKRCSVCVNKARGLVGKITRPCEDCGVAITGTAALKRCKGCNKKRIRARANAGPQRRIRKHRQRARKFGVAYEHINSTSVFETARWRCVLCGVRTLKSKRGTAHPRAPELDHVIPLSLGGPHTIDNVQLACRACNHSKGATIRGQLSLFSCVAA